MTDFLCSWIELVWFKFNVHITAEFNVHITATWARTSERAEEAFAKGDTADAGIERGCGG